MNAKEGGEKMSEQITVGDVFVSKWGYDQTNVDFYEVVGVTASGKSVWLRYLQKTVVDETVGTDFVSPVAGSAAGDKFRKTLQPALSGSFPEWVKVSSFQNAYKTEWDATHGQTAWHYGR
jgi:hypothetical protein